MWKRFLVLGLLVSGLWLVCPNVPSKSSLGRSFSFAVMQNEPVSIASGKIDGFTISGDGSWIAYKSDSDFHLVVIEPDGSNPHNISLPTDGRLWGAIENSPDGQWIYYQGINNTGVDTTSNLWKLRPDGSDISSVAQFGMNATIGYPSSLTNSPSGTQWAYKYYQSDGGTENHSIYITDQNWQTSQRVFFDPNFEIRSLYWSTAGIAFWGMESLSNYSVYLMEPDGSNLRVLATNQTEPEAYSYPNGSPDGSYVLSTSSGTGSEMFVWIFSSDGSNPFPAAKGYYWTRWFPTGDKIAFIGVPWSSSTTPSGLYVMDLPSPITDLDSDGDGLSNLEEWSTYGTDFELGDSDSDGLGDGIEVRTGFDPLDWDTDDDGIGDGLEFVLNFGEDTTATPLPEGFIRITLQWSNYSMIATTNSTMLCAAFNATNQEFTFGVDGMTGTSAICNLTLPLEMVEDPSSIAVSLDGSPLLFTYSIIGDTIQIYIEYSHSTHQLSIQLGSETPPISPPPGIPGFPLVAISIGLLFALGFLLIIRARQRRLQ